MGNSEILRHIKYVRIAGLSFIAFLLMFTYSIARPATESLFLEEHTSKGLPLVWILVAAAMIVAVAIYNYFVAKVDLIKLLGLTSLFSAAILVALVLAQIAKSPLASYGLYVWKDVYVVVLAEIFYTYVNSVFPIKTARWTYGLLGVLGSTGAILGNLAVGALAQSVGTVTTLWYLVPLLLIMWIFCIPFVKYAGIGSPIEAKYKFSQLSQSITLIRKSSYLTLILALVAIVQIVVTLIDFQYNAVVERVFTELDIRTAMIGKIYAVISFGTLALHFFTGPILRVVGIPITLLVVPAILATSLASFMIVPRFLTMAVTKVASKCLDYSLFRASKEILYIPLSYAEKTLGKSVVDMLTYRIAKAGASFLLMGLVAAGITALVNWMTLALIAIWLVITIIIMKRFRKTVSREEEMIADKIGPS